VPRKNEWPWLGLALLLRLAFALKLGSRFHQIDESGFHDFAAAVAAQGPFHVPQTFPAIPVLFFAAFFALSGTDHLLWPRLAQAFVGVAAVWATGRLTEELSGSERAGRFALILSSFYPFFVYYSEMVLSETTYVAAVALALLLLTRCLRERGESLRRCAAAGLLLGVAALCRTEALPIAAVMLALGLIPVVRRRLPAKAWACVAAGWLCLPVLWMARNRALVGSWTLDEHGGITLLHGTMLLDYNEQDTSVAMAELEKTDLWKQGQALPPAERDKLFTHAAFRFMRDNPGVTLVDKIYTETERSHPGAGLGRWGLVIISLLFEPWLIVLGLWGLAKLAKERPLELSPAWLFLLGTMGIHMIVVSQMRYRLPIMPLLIAGACSLIATRLQSRSR
jgi:4-amino-4-deoxy-L-arabinose transferase-like glycosyltransferase